MIPEKYENEYEECGCCGYFHRIGYTGDCRDDEQRFMLDEFEDEEILISYADFRRRRERSTEQVEHGKET